MFMHASISKHSVVEVVYLAVQVGFYGDGVECLFFIWRPGLDPQPCISIISPVTTEY